MTVRITHRHTHFCGLFADVLGERLITHNGSSTPMVLVRPRGERVAVLYRWTEVAPLLPGVW